MEKVVKFFIVSALCFYSSIMSLISCLGDPEFISGLLRGNTNSFRIAFLFIITVFLFIATYVTFLLGIIAGFKELEK